MSQQRFGSTLIRGLGRTGLAAVGLFMAGLLMAPRTASAMPAFARATDLACSACHTAWPKLNRFGRAYKENGYAIERAKPAHQVGSGDWLSIPDTPPFAVMMNSRPYDRQKRGETQLRALHELEIMAGGAVFRYGSFFTEIELEDETGFDPELGHAWGGFHPHQAFNVIGGYAPVFAADPYNTLADRRFTRARPRAIDLGFQTGVTLRGNSQMISVYGREPASNRLFYLFTYAKDRDDDFEGEGSVDYTGRLALDLTKELTVGVYGVAGREDALEPLDPVDPESPLVTFDRDFWRAGGDVQLQRGPINFEGVVLVAEDDLPEGSAGADDRNLVFSGETYFVFDKEVYPDLPNWFFKFVPAVRVDWFEVPDSPQNRTDLVANVQYYALENARISAEFAQQVSGVGDAQRFTIFAVFGF